MLHTSDFGKQDTPALSFYNSVLSHNRSINPEHHNSNIMYQSSYYQDDTMTDRTDPLTDDDSSSCDSDSSYTRFRRHKIQFRPELANVVHPFVYDEDGRPTLTYSGEDTDSQDGFETHLTGEDTEMERQEIEKLYNRWVFMSEGKPSQKLRITPFEKYIARSIASENRTLDDLFKSGTMKTIIQRAVILAKIYYV